MLFRISSVVLEVFNNFLRENRELLVHSGSEPNGANQMFFEWQAAGGWEQVWAVALAIMV